MSSACDKWEASAEGVAISFSFACLLCQPIFASLVIHGFDPRDSLIEVFEGIVNGTQVHADEESHSIKATVNVSA